MLEHFITVAGLHPGVDWFAAPHLGAPSYLKKEEKEQRPLYLVIGPSASGKDYFVRKACSIFEMKALKSYTTRPPRSPEDRSHHFVPPEWFAEKVISGELLAHARYAGYEYGALKKDADKADFYIVDLDTAFTLRERMKRPCKIIRIVADWSVRFLRMLRRYPVGKPDKEAIFDRIYQDEMLEAQYWDGVEDGQYADYDIDSDWFEEMEEFESFEAFLNYFSCF